MSFYHYKERPQDLECPLDNLGYLIKLLHEASLKEVEENMKAFDLTAAQWRPLVALDLYAIQTPAELAKLLCHDLGATTRLLDRLEKKDLSTDSVP